MGILSRQDSPGSQATAPRPRSRLPAALSVTVALYIALDTLLSTGVSGGFALRDRLPGALGASPAEVAAVAAASDGRALAPGLALDAFRLGQRLGIGAELAALASGQSGPFAERQAQARRIANEDGMAERLGLAPLAPWLPAGPSEAAALMSIIEARNLALAQRVEAGTSARHRHLLLAGLHVGVYMAALALLPDGPARPDAARIAEHASLAGVPEPLWRPLAQVPATTGAARAAAYVAAVEALEASLAAPIRPRTSP